jgi:flagellar hook-associated protein 2
VATIQSLGVGSGLDVSSIIQQLLTIERQPLARLERAASGVQSEISLYGNIRSKADAVGTAARTLADEDTWRKTTVNLNGAEEFTVTAASTASPVSLDIEINTLAQRQSISTQAFDSASSLVGTGILTIQRGSWSADFGAFTPDLDSPGIEVPIGYGQDSLEGIRDAINDADAGVTASILTDANGARLVIRSNDPGAENGFSISTLGGTDEFDALAFTQQTSPATASGAQGNARATNLQGRINGAVVESTTNTLSNVLDGISITATKTTASPRNVAIERDSADMKAKVDTFVSAYNDLISYIKVQTAYNEATKTAAPLQGDRVALMVQSQLRSAAIDTTEASDTFTRLSEIGITLQLDGKLQVDASKLDKAFEQLDEVASLFSRDEDGTTQDGLALRIADLIETMTDPDGTIDSRQALLRQRLQRNEDDQARLEDRLAATEARLKAQYTALDGKMASLNSLGSYIAQQFGASK